MQLGLLRTLISSELSALGHPVPELPDITPCPDIALGDVSSSVCMTVAIENRLDPQGLANECAERLRTRGVDVQAVQGYLNFRLNSLPQGEFDPRELKCRTATVFLPAQTHEVQGWSYRRLLARAVFHASVLRWGGVEPELSIGGHTTKAETLSLRGESQRVWWPSLFELKPPCERSQMLRDLEERLTESRADQVFVYLAPNSLRRKEFQAFYRAKIQDKPNIVLVCPSKEWFSQIDGEGVEEALPPAGQLSLYVYLARELDGVSLYPAEASLPISDNLLWMSRVLLERVTTLLPALKPSGIEVLRIEVSSEFYTLGLLSRALAPLFRRAALTGSFSECFTAYVAFLRRLNVVLNRPHHRVALTSGQITLQELEILAGAERALSDSIDGWLTLGASAD